MFEHIYERNTFNWVNLFHFTESHCIYICFSSSRFRSKLLTSKWYSFKFTSFFCGFAFSTFSQSHRSTSILKYFFASLAYNIVENWYPSKLILKSNQYSETQCFLEIENTFPKEGLIFQKSSFILVWSRFLGSFSSYLLCGCEEFVKKC